eukprot:365048-Chlamydomonas_euryale.AAC.9
MGPMGANIGPPGAPNIGGSRPGIGIGICMPTIPGCPGTIIPGKIPYGGMPGCPWWYGCCDGCCGGWDMLGRTGGDGAGSLSCGRNLYARGACGCACAASALSPWCAGLGTATPSSGGSCSRLGRTAFKGLVSGLLTMSFHVGMGTSGAELVELLGRSACFLKLPRASVAGTSGINVWFSRLVFWLASATLATLPD